LVKASARELDPDRRIIAMLSERCSVWQRIGSKNEKTHETRTHLVGQSRSGRDLKARTTVEKTDAADD